MPDERRAVLAPRPVGGREPSSARIFPRWPPPLTRAHTCFQAKYQEEPPLPSPRSLLFHSREITCAAYSRPTRPRPHVIAPVATQLSPQPSTRRLIRRTAKQVTVLDWSNAAAIRQSPLSKPVS